MEKPISWGYCPFSRDGARCVHDMKQNKCEFYDCFSERCAIRSVSDLVNNYDVEYAPIMWTYDPDGKKLEPADETPNLYIGAAFNLGAIPPLLERIAKALEAIADK